MIHERAKEVSFAELKDFFRRIAKQMSVETGFRQRLIG
jgi:hypothetical protein